MKYLYGVFAFLLFISSNAFATHLSGGEIRATYISGQTYKISVLLYMDSQNGQGAANSQTSVKVCMGDGNTIDISKVSMTPTTDSSGIVIALFEANYTYPTSGVFQISVAESNRSPVVNFTDATNSTFFIWTVLNTQLLNSTPVLPQLRFIAGVKQVFSLDLKPALTDGDSVSIRLQKLSKPSPGTCGVRMLEKNFIYPNEVSKTGTFKIDQVGKKLLWTAPEQIGRFVYAIVVDEWRDGIKISETYREGTIIVIDKPGQSVEVPAYVYPEEIEGLITSVTNLDSKEISISVEAYPVPTQDFVNVKAYSRQSAVIKLQLIDLKGRIVEEIKSASPVFTFQEQFDLRNYTPGVYIIRAGNDREFISKKILR